jgi:hypothetical protein
MGKYIMVGDILDVNGKTLVGEFGGRRISM